MKILLAIMFIGLAVFPNSVELSPMQSYATTSSGRGAKPLQAQGQTEEVPYYPPEELLYYYSSVDTNYHPIPDPKRANLKVKDGFYVGIYVAGPPGRAHPIYGVKPDHNPCIQTIEPYTFKGQIAVPVPKLQRDYEVFYRRLKLAGDG